VESTKIKIRHQIEQAGPGSFHFPEDFLEVADDDQIRLGLSRLVKEEFLTRLGLGIYYYPKEDPYLGKVSPALEKVAEALANRDKVKIRPTGAHALNMLGLSTQVPMKLAYFTSGPSRKIKIGARTIQFINRSPKKMAYTGTTSGPVMTALMELGKGNLTEELKAKILQLFRKEHPSVLKTDLKLAPKWIGEIFVPPLNDILQAK
jgi:hypothetical protein